MNINETLEQTVIRAAKANRMTPKAWGGCGETRIYLKRTNAAQTDAGYIRLWTGEDGKSKWSYVPEKTGGKGSMTAASEGQSVFATAKEYRSQIAAAKKEARINAQYIAPGMTPLL